MCKDGTPRIVKNKSAKDFLNIIRTECIKQKVKKLKGDLSFICEIDICKRKDYDIDAVLKLLFDSLQGLAYIDDKQIIDLRVRKYRKSDVDKLTILIEEI